MWNDNTLPEMCVFLKLIPDLLHTLTNMQQCRRKFGQEDEES